MTIKKAAHCLLIPFLISACASGERKNNSSNTAPSKTAKVLELEKKIREREDEIQDIKDRNRVINAKNINQKAMAQEAVVVAKPQSSKIEVNPQISVIPKTDLEMYQDLQVQYEQNNQVGFFSRFKIFQKQYAKSHLTDEVLYLAGLMTLSNKNYGASLKYFNQIIKEYPSSSKSSAAVFAKGVALKKMNLKDQAKSVFVGVVKKYPGSVEAMRAENELKILR